MTTDTQLQFGLLKPKYVSASCDKCRDFRQYAALTALRSWAADHTNRNPDHTVTINPY